MNKRVKKERDAGERKTQNERERERRERERERDKERATEIFKGIHNTVCGVCAYRKKTQKKSMMVYFSKIIVRT